MRDLVMNVLAAALMVCVTTVSSVTFGAVLALVVLAPQGEVDPNTAGLAGLVGGLMAAVVGVFFCVATLFFAALSMPPALWLIRVFDLPRPAMDMIGGGMMGLFCATIGIGMFDHDKFAGMITPEAGQVLATVGLVAGCALGWVRHAMLVQPKMSARQFV